MISQTSLMAYEKLKPNMNRRENQVLEALKEIQPATNKMISLHLHWDINRVTGRTNSLVKKGIVECKFTAKCPITKNTAKFWIVRR